MVARLTLGIRRGRLEAHHYGYTTPYVNNESSSSSPDQLMMRSDYNSPIEYEVTRLSFSRLDKN